MSRQEFCKLIRQFENAISYSDQSDDWKSTGRDAFHSVLDAAKHGTGNFNKIYNAIHKLENGLKYSAQTDSWKDFKREAAYVLFFSEKVADSETESLTHLALYLLEVERHWTGNWDDRSDWLQNVKSFINPVDYSLFMTDIVTNISELTRDDPMSSNPGGKYSKSNFVSAVESQIERLRDAASQINYHTKNCGIAKATGGGASIAGGVMAAAGMILAPFSGGLSLGLTGAGIAVGGAGAATTLGAAITKGVIESNNVKNCEGKKILMKDIAKVCYAIELFDNGVKNVRNFLNTRNGSNLIQELKGIDYNQMFDFTYKGVKTVYNTAKTIKIAGIVRMIRPELAAELGSKIAVVSTAPGIQVPGWILRFTNRTSFVIIKAGSTAATCIGAVTAALAIVTGIFDLIGGIKDAQGSSEVVKKLRNSANSLEKTLDGIKQFWQ